MTDERIGQFVTRHDEGADRTKPHFVESLIDDEPVTRCGRRLRRAPGRTYEYEVTPHLPACRVCVP